MRNLSAIVAFLGVVSTAQATTIFTTFGPGHTFISGGNFLIGSFNPTDNTRQEIAASFTPGSTLFLDSILIAAQNLGGTNQLTVYLAAGAVEPGSAIETFSLTGIPGTATLLTLNSASRPLLSAGTKYWVVLSAADLTNTYDGWNQSFTLGGFAGRTGGSGAWSAASSNLPAFEVNASIPEPSTMLLLGSALSVLFAVKHRLIG